jgi:hypothetical protein
MNMPTDLNAFAAALLAIHELMDGKEWSADTLQSIAEVLEGVGLHVKEPLETATE